MRRVDEVPSKAVIADADGMDKDSRAPLDGASS